MPGEGPREFRGRRAIEQRLQHAFPRSSAQGEPGPRAGQHVPPTSENIQSYSLFRRFRRQSSRTYNGAVLRRNSSLLLKNTTGDASMNANIRRFQGELAIRALRRLEPLQDSTQPSSDPQLWDCVAADRVVLEKLLQDVFRSRPVVSAI